MNKRFIFFLMASLACLACVCGADVTNAGTGVEIARKAFAEAEFMLGRLRQTKDFAELSGLLGAYRSNSSDLTRQRLLQLLADEIRSTNVAELQNLGPVVISNRVVSGKMTRLPDSEVIVQDIFIFGGRAAWAIEKLLDCKLPPVTENSTSAEIEDAVFEAHYKIEESFLPPESRLEVSLLSREKRINLAEASETPGPAFAKLSKDSEPQVRKSVAANPRTPVQVLAHLLNRDSDPEVRALAKRNLERARSLPKK